MKIYCFFTEPASYTLDLIEYVYNPLKIDFCFLKSESEAKTNINVSENIFLDRISFFKYLKLIIRVLNNYDIVIFNSWIINHNINTPVNEPIMNPKFGGKKFR